MRSHIGVILVGQAESSVSRVTHDGRVAKLRLACPLTADINLNGSCIHIQDSEPGITSTSPTCSASKQKKRKKGDI